MGTRTKGATDEKRYEATEARHGWIEGDLGPGRDVGGPGPRDQLGQAGAGRSDAGDGAHSGGECHADSTRGGGGPRLLSDRPGVHEVGA